MKFEDLNNYPEYPDNKVVDQFCRLVLAEAEEKIPEETLGRLRYLGDKQWHTYELPSKELQIRMKNWLIQSGVLDSSENLADALVVSFYFGLDKEFYKTILNRYVGENKWQFVKDFENSLGDTIDPWWSLKKNRDNP